MKKILLSLGALAIVCVSAAQPISRHEFSINAAGGLSSLQYSPAVGTHSSGFGGGGGVGYTFHFSPTWAIVSGLDMAVYNSSFKADAIMNRYTIPSPVVNPTPGADNTFYFQADYTGYEETQSALLLNIPIMAQYTLPLGSMGFYAAAGAKIGIPVSATYDAKATQLTTKGYSNFTGEEYTQSHGFGTTSNPSYNGDLDFQVTCMLALEAGLKWKLSERWNLYTGIYFDYGLTNTSSGNDKTMAVYNGTKNYTYNSALQSTNNGVNVDKINTMAVGLKVKIALR